MVVSLALVGLCVELARCFACRFGTGEDAAWEAELAHWTGWVGRRMAAFRDLARAVDAFTVPSRHMLARFARELAGVVPPERFHLLPYGFDRARLAGRVRAPPTATPAAPYVFAYIGRHVPAKGLDLLVRAALLLVEREPATLGRFRVLLYGRPDGANTASVRRLLDAGIEAAAGRLGAGARGALLELVQFRGEYANERIAADVFSHVDCIVVPSIWSENAPLVIHEAQQARIPVVASDAPGMAEFVADGVNGFLFAHRSVDALSAALGRALRDPAAAARLGARGYLASPTGDVPSVTAQVDELCRIYEREVAARGA
jgi:glycosyltransferase involved in cell wall biosynthesis